MRKDTETSVKGRLRSRLVRARERGYLIAGCSDSTSLIREFGLWCWRLRLPMVWVERRSQWSRYGRVRVDMLTTVNMMTSRGQAELNALMETWQLHTPGSITAHDARWERVPLRRAGEFAKAVFTIVMRSGNFEPNRSKLRNIDARGNAKPFKLEPMRAVSA